MIKNSLEKIFLLFSLISLFLTSLALGDEVEPHLFFEVRDLQSDTLYFQGEEIQSMQNKFLIKETTYRNAVNKSVIQYSKCLLAEHDLSIEKYDLINYESGKTLQIRRINQAEIILEYFEPKKMKQPVKKNLKIEGEFLGEALHAMITRRWAELVNKGNIDFRLFVPHRFDTFGFHLKRLQKNPDGLWFSMAPISLLIRALAPTMEFMYSDDDHHHLKEYRGPSPVPIAGEIEKPVRVLFDYEHGKGK